MNRFAYLIYAAIVILGSNAINNSLERNMAGSYRSWGGSTSSGSGSGWSGSHK